MLQKLRLADAAGANVDLVPRGDRSPKFKLLALGWSAAWDHQRGLDE
ncbi:hypothetical protein [Bradyrhizobium guangdongense]|nr:hypothetical protein [Bradyrhizobium guangdongense]